MFRRLRTTSLAGSGALVLVLVVSGVVAAASVLTAMAAPVADPAETEVVDTTLTFEDVDGNSVDDDCQEDEAADEAAAAASEVEADLDGDGMISVSEAAQTDRTGGTNCNHGGYVSGVAQDTATDEDAEEEEPAEDVEEDTEEDTVTCEAPADEETAPVDEPVTETDVEEPKNHGEVVSAVAESDEVGGKNCNHGGAVSDASHADNEARKEAREAAKEARAAEREAAKAARDAAKGSKGKGHNH